MTDEAIVPVEQIDEAFATRWASTPQERASIAQDAARHRIAAEKRGYEEAKAQGWQPIESAPKDGTVIDVWIDGEFPGRRSDVSWREPSDSEWWVHGGDTIETPDATWHDCFGPLGKSEQPTHWMPLPTPPALANMERPNG